MKLIINKINYWLTFPVCLAIFLMWLPASGFAQNDSIPVKNETSLPAKIKPVKNTFQSVWIIDNQTVLVPVKGTLEIDIMHRFGTWKKGYEDFWGLFAPSNIRLGVNYSPINRLNLGIGITKEKMLWDASAKYSIITQTKGQYPVSVTFYSNVAYVGTKSKYSVPKVDNSGIEYLEEKHNTDRFLFFQQLIIARKITDKLSVQIAPSWTHQNAVGGYYTKNDSTGKEIFKSMKHDHFALSVAARYKLTNVTSLMLNYDQPLTQHPTNNPNPNLSFGVEFNTSSHSFQLFFGNYYSLNQQRNNLFNQNDPFSSKKPDYVPVAIPNEFLIGFNITRLWNY